MHTDGIGQYCGTRVYAGFFFFCFFFSLESITVHGLGSAIHRAINLALQLQETATPPLSLHVTTSTVQLVDDLEPIDDVSVEVSCQWEVLIVWDVLLLFSIYRTRNFERSQGPALPFTSP